MDAVLKNMIARYECRTDEDYHNALREIIQDIALLGLWRAKFFEHAAFYGGTALRVLHQLNRFSEDLDFVLLRPDGTFKLTSYFNALKSELASFGMEVDISEKKKIQKSQIQSAFLKTNTREYVLRIGAPKELLTGFQSEELTKIKLEIDIDSCSGFVTETHDLFYPIPFSVRALDTPSLFAGKLHAVLCRRWGKRVKGRDWFDMLWFIQRKTPVRLGYLEAKMRQTEHYSDVHPLTLERLVQLLHSRIEELDIERAKDDVYRFVGRTSILEGWTSGAFKTAAEKLVAV